jgi:hypothetical protein
MLNFAALLLVFQTVTLHAPSLEETNRYALKESISTSEFGKITMTGTEKRHIGAPSKGRRQVEIVFDVQLTEKQISGANAEKWAAAELADLRQSDSGYLDDHDRLVLSDGVAADAYPIFPPRAIKVGDQWTVSVNGVKCRYVLDKFENGHAVISTDSKAKATRGTLLRSGSWTVDVATGRLLAWHLHSEVTYAGGGKETVDSSGQLVGG